AVRCSWARRTRRTGASRPSPTPPARCSSWSRPPRRHPLMATFVLLHGAGSDPWYWHLVVPQLRDRGHDVVTPTFPCDDDRAGLPEYVGAAVAAIADRRDLVGDAVEPCPEGGTAERNRPLVLVAQSLAGFVAPLVCEQVPVDLMVLVAAMVPRPGESGAA